MEEPGRSCDYPCFTAMLTANGTVLNDMIVEPTKTRVFDRNGYRFVFGGCVWGYCVARGVPVPHRAEPFLAETGVIPILLTEACEATFIGELMERVSRLGRAPD